MKRIFTSLFTLLAVATVNSQNIKFIAPELYPEGTAYYKKDKSFYVTSLHLGKVGKVTADGKYTVFVEDKDLISVVGTVIDNKTSTIYVAISDPGASTKTNPATQGKLAKVAAYDLTTGKRKFLVDLGILNTTGTGNFANDLTLDEVGNLYVTNSFAPIIYKIDSKGTASIFAKNDAWAGAGFNLNGITYHKDGFLIAAQMEKGLLYKVDIKNPQNITVIKTDTLKGADGLVLNDANSELLVISNKTNKIYKLTTKDKWVSATVDKSVESIETFPTTGVYVEGKYYVLNAKLNELFNPTPGVPLSTEFTLQEIKF